MPKRMSPRLSGSWCNRSRRPPEPVLSVLSLWAGG